MVFLTIFLLTFNFEKLKPPNAMNGDVERLVWPDENMTNPSIYVVGLQGLSDPKGNFEGPAWMREIRNELFAKGYAQLTEEVESNGAIMAVFCKHKFLPTVDLSSVKSGTGMLSERGKSSCATAVSLKIAGNAFCFINTYMRYGQYLFLNSEERRNILVKLKDSIGPNMDVDSHDAVVWLGSMAFMLNPGDYATNDELRAWAMRGMYKNVLYYDELGHLLASDDYFQSFSEPDINFPPTTWYTNRNGIEQNGTPLYTDRIFFKASKPIDKLTAKNYNSLYYLAVAKHMPVFLALTLSHDAKNTVTYDFLSLPPYNLIRWSLRIDRKIEEYDKLSSTRLPKWLTDNSTFRVYEVHQFTLWKKDLKGSIELPIVKSEYSSTDQGNRQALLVTVDKTKLSTLGAGGYVLCYIIDNKLVSVSDIFRL